MRLVRRFIFSLSICILFSLSCTATNTGNNTGDGEDNEIDIDVDDDGLIEIKNAEMLYNIRYNLAGTSYDDEELDTGMGNDTGITTGCGGTKNGVASCNGYELVADIDLLFILRPDFTTWTPVGNNTNPFIADFEGNGKTITNLIIRSTTQYTGFFGVVGDEGSVQKLTFLTATVASNYSGLVVRPDYTEVAHVGVLAGWLQNGSIVNNVAVSGTSMISPANASADVVGGLVGRNSGTIQKSSVATTTSVAGDDNNDHVGGLAGVNGGTIQNSYSSANVDGGSGSDQVGGLVGRNEKIIQDSYVTPNATGNAHGGGGEILFTNDSVGGLVGGNTNTGSIEKSYANANVYGGSASNNLIYSGVGGLVGFNQGSILNTYSSGSVDGGAKGDYVGGLVGASHTSSSIQNSYSTATVLGGPGKDDVGLLIGLTGFTPQDSYYAIQLIDLIGIQNLRGIPQTLLMTLYPVLLQAGLWSN